MDTEIARLQGTDAQVGSLLGQLVERTAAGGGRVLTNEDHSTTARGAVESILAQEGAPPELMGRLAEAIENDPSKTWDGVLWRLGNDSGVKLEIRQLEKLGLANNRPHQLVAKAIQAAIQGDLKKLSVIMSAVDSAQFSSTDLGDLVTGFSDDKRQLAQSLGAIMSMAAKQAAAAKGMDPMDFMLKYWQIRNAMGKYALGDQKHGHRADMHPGNLKMQDAKIALTEARTDKVRGDTKRPRAPGSGGGSQKSRGEIIKGHLAIMADATGSDGTPQFSDSRLITEENALRAAAKAGGRAWKQALARMSKTAEKIDTATLSRTSSQIRQTGRDKSKEVSDERRFGENRTKRLHDMVGDTTKAIITAAGKDARARADADAKAKAAKEKATQARQKENRGVREKQLKAWRTEAAGIRKKKSMTADDRARIRNLEGLIRVMEAAVLKAARDTGE